MARPVLCRGSFELQSATRRHRCEATSMYQTHIEQPPLSLFLLLFFKKFVLTSPNLYYKAVTPIQQTFHRVIRLHSFIVFTFGQRYLESTTELVCDKV